MSRIKKSNSVVLYLVLSLLSFVWIVPIIFAIINAFKSSVEFNSTNFWALPKHIGLADTWTYLSERVTLGDSIVNSLFYGLVGTVLALLFSCLAAYGLTKLPIKGKFYWFLLIYSGTIFPFQLYLVPVYSGLSKVGLYDTKLGMLLFYTAICIPFCTFLLRNFFMDVDDSLLESAKLEGCSDMGILLKIMIPMARGPLAALFMIQFSFIWNDLLFGLTFAKSENTRPIMATISSLSNAGSASNTPALLVACLIASIPTVLIFVLLNKDLEQGFVIGGK